MGRHRSGPLPRPGRRAQRTPRRGGRWLALTGSILGTGLAVGVGVAVAPAEVVETVTASEVDEERRELSGAVLGAGSARVAPQAQMVLEPRRLGRPPVPKRSGQGRRVVFSQSAQRVWLIREDGSTQRSYLVSGSAYDNLNPGSYRVYSRSEQAWGIDDSGTMRWFVRFTRGPNAAIGFHDIPVDDGAPVQTHAQLGTPLSHGCIRQRSVDAKVMWEFAPLGTSVVVVA